MAREEAVKLSFAGVVRAAAQDAFRGGLSGAMAMAIQVTTLMWMRTAMNYQYRHGLSTMEALRFLYNDGGRGLGGIRRFYRGLAPALVQGPMSRFGDTAANTGMLSLLNSMDSTRELPVSVKTATASVGAGLFRIVLMPIDAMKTALQVEGKQGLKLLGNKMRVGGPTVLFHGALASAGATMAGHFPWFFTYNTLDHHLPRYKELHKRLLRSAFIGFTASAVSDTISNSIRVIKTTKQTYATPITYQQAVREIIAEDGYAGLFGRGLKTRIIANGMQGLLFSVLWRLISDKMAAGKH